MHELEISLKEDLHELSWMGDATRAQALRKMSQLTRKFGYPHHWIDYSSVKLSVTTIWATCSGWTPFHRQGSGQNRQAGGPGRVGHDAADRECVL